MPIIVVGSGATTTFAELVTEFYARGFDYLNQDAAGQTRAKRYVNAGRAELDRQFLWPWRQASETGEAPFEIPDLGPVQSVTDENGSVLRKMTPYGDQTEGYQVDWTSGVPTVTAPTGGSITVRYWAVTPNLEGDEDTPASPQEAHYLIIDLAVRRAYRDSDNHESAEAIQGEVERQFDALLFQYPPGQADGPDDRVAVTFSSEDW